ncbi:hypothetical protein [Paenibacillus ihuae]|uniref:hypothetical protein n=1 Tax=Paenibacillus ihuae TaxID=1232431 RepID=UPI0006D551E1|nr:hypothetical protein [Paenibacillus ihuae]
MEHEGRMMVCGGTLENDDFLFSSSGGLFIRCFTDPNGQYAEYLLHTPDELHKISSGEMIILEKQEEMFFGRYLGKLYANDTFIIGRNIIIWTDMSL